MEILLPPLDGIKVVDLTKVLAGPFCTMMLADMGAEVIKIEAPGAGDESRGWAPFVDGWSSYFLGVNRNKKSLAIDLKTPEGAEALTHLIREADVLVENFRPGSLTRLGFGFEEAQRLNPRLVYCSISGYGQTGPRRHQPGYDVVIQGESGFMAVTGEPDGEPVRAGIAVTDYLAGLYANQGILLALLERSRTGRGQHVDVALFDSLISVLTLPVGIFNATGENPERMGNGHASVAPYETLSAKDGNVIVAVGNPGLWKRLCDAIDHPELEVDPRFASNTDRLRNRQALRGELEAIFSSITVDDLVRQLQACGVPCGKVRSIAEALSDPQVAAREMIVSLSHDELGAVKVLGNPVKLSTHQGSVWRSAPRLGEHTEEVLRAVNTKRSPSSEP